MGELSIPEVIKFIGELDGTKTTKKVNISSALYIYFSVRRRSSRALSKED